MKYRKVTTKNNRIQYWVDGKMRSADSIRENLLQRLEEEPEFETDEVTPEEPKIVNTKICIFDDLPATHQRYALGNMYGLCDEHYLGKTTGKLIQRVNEINQSS